MTGNREVAEAPSKTAQQRFRSPDQLPVTPGRRAWRKFKRHRLAWLSTWFLGAVILVVLIAPVYLPYAPDQLSEDQYQAPSGQHWFGTDVHGRDLMSRVLYGARISLLVGTLGTSVSLIIGTLWGAVAGYLGGRWDGFLMRTVDILYTLPSIIFVIVLMTVAEAWLKDGWGGVSTPEAGAILRMVILFVGLGSVSWLTMARIVRGQVLSLRQRSFVEASRALGASHARILFRHILPNVTGVIIVYLALTAPTIILSESFLSFLGLGIQPPQASLGSLIAEGASQINPIRIYWWMVFYPIVILVSTLLALNFVGDGLREALDPRSR
jgi:peptide/nickel transport system permease protein/oligopeptide transport system permease protein